MLEVWRRFCEDDNGATAIEYALISALIAVPLVLSLMWLRNRVEGVFLQLAMILR